MKLLRFLKKIFLDIFTPILKLLLKVFKMLCFFSMPVMSVELLNFISNGYYGTLFIPLFAFWFFMQIAFSFIALLINSDGDNWFLPKKSKEYKSFKDVDSMSVILFFLSFYYFKPTFLLKAFLNYLKKTWENA